MKKTHSLLMPAVVAGAISLLASGIACADNVFVVSNGSNSVQEISNNTVSTFIATDLNSPTGIAIDGGDIYVANNGSGANAGYVAEFSLATGNFITNYSTGENGPRGLAFDSVGNLYVTNQTDGTIVKIPTGGGTGSVVASGFNFSNGLAFDASGNLYVTSGGGSFIDKIAFSSPGVVSTVSPFITSGLNSPNGLAFDSAGNLLVVSHGSQQVLEFSSTGAPLGSAVLPLYASSLSGPKTLAFDSVGDFYVTDATDNTVTEYNSSGALIQLFSSDIFNNPAFSGPCFVAIQLVPEPSTYALLIAGLGFLFFMHRRKTAMLARVTVS